MHNISVSSMSISPSAKELGSGFVSVKLKIRVMARRRHKCIILRVHKTKL